MGDAVRVLVVEDEPVLRGLYQDNLQEHGFAVTAAADGQEGLELLRAQAFDVVLLDLNMPRLDGLGLLRHMRAEDMEAEAIVLTATAVFLIVWVVQTFWQARRKFPGNGVKA